MLLAWLLACFTCQCLEEDELIKELVFITRDLIGNMYLLLLYIVVVCSLLAKVKDDYCYHMTLSSGGM